MTVALYTFLKIDGTTVEINADRIDYLEPYMYALPSGQSAVGTRINVDTQNIIVQNSLIGINSVIPSTTIPQTLPSGIIPTYPTVMGSSQIDPFRLIERRYYELSTIFNTPDGMSSRIFFSSVTTLPPWAGGSSASNGNVGWNNKSFDLPPPEFRDYRTWNWTNVNFIGQDFLPFRTNISLLPYGPQPIDQPTLNVHSWKGFDTYPFARTVIDTPLQSIMNMDTNNYNNIALGIP